VKKWVIVLDSQKDMNVTSQSSAWAVLGQCLGTCRTNNKLGPNLLLLKEWFVGESFLVVLVVTLSIDIDNSTTSYSYSSITLTRTNESIRKDAIG